MRTGTLLNDQAILIEGEKIVEIGPSVLVSRHASGKVKVVDLSGLTVLPGLIDCHAHVLGNLKDLSASAPLRMSSPQATLWGVHNLQTWLNHGFTTLRDAGESDLAYGQLALRDSIRMGLIKGPRMRKRAQNWAFHIVFPAMRSQICDFGVAAWKLLLHSTHGIIVR